MIDFEQLRKAAYEAWLSDKPKFIAIDTETDPHFYPFCVQIAWRGAAHYLELDTPAAYELAREIIRGTPSWVFHNAKFDLGRLLDANLIDREDIDYLRFDDTETIAHLVDEHQKKGLKPLAQRYLGESTDEAKVLNETFRKLKLKKSDGFDKLPREVLMPYAIKDAEFTFRLYKELGPELILSDDLCRLYKLERELTLALLDMEMAGMGLDLEYLKTVTAEYGSALIEQELLIRDLSGNEHLNPHSPKQLMEALSARGIQTTSTGIDALRAFKHDPLVVAVLELRKLAKLHGTYLLGLEKEQKAGILYPSFRQHGTRTGRMSSGAYEGD